MYKKWNDIGFVRGLDSTLANDVAMPVKRDRCGGDQFALR